MPQQETAQIPFFFPGFAEVQAMYLPLISKEDALDHTKEKLLKESPFQNCKCILDSHSNMEAYASPDTVSCIVFNFGYLPGGDHTISTRIKTSMPALSSSLKLLKKAGFCLFVSTAGEIQALKSMMLSLAG